MSFPCAVCGETHGALPDLGFPYPDYALSIPEEEWPERVTATPDRCVVDEAYYFVRGVIFIPVEGDPEGWGIGAWVSLKRENYEHYLAHNDDPDIGPFFGWLANEIACYEATTNPLKTRVHFRGNNLRPSIELEPTDHALAVDQRNGISVQRAWELIHPYL